MTSKLSAAIIAAVSGFSAAFAACFVFFYFVARPALPVDARPTNQSVASPQPTSADIPLDPEIKPEDVKSVSIRTVYKGYFQPGDKCAKTYDEYFGNNDGVSSSSSPCTVQVTFDRQGNATRSIEIRRWDKTANDYHVVETSNSTAHISSSDFDALVKNVVSNEAFKAFKRGMSITVSNCSVTVAYGNDTKTAMSNVDEKTIVFLEMINAFKQLEKRLDWKAA